MPREIIMVSQACSICGEIFVGSDALQKAVDCEAKHVRVKDLIETKYLINGKGRILHALTNGKYAHTLKVEYEDGAVKTYVLDNSAK